MTEIKKLKNYNRDRLCKRNHNGTTRKKTELKELKDTNERNMVENKV